MLLGGCYSPIPQASSNPKASTASPSISPDPAKDWTDENPDSVGPKLVYIFRDPKEPGVQRELTEARESAMEDKSHLFIYMAPTQTSFTSALEWARNLPAEGLIIVAPHRKDGETVQTRIKPGSMRVMSLDGELQNSSRRIPNFPALESDYRLAGQDAATKAVREADRRHWSVDTTGAIIFTSNSRTAVSDATDAEVMRLMASGVHPGHLFICPLEDSDLTGARAFATQTILKMRESIATWFILGCDDMDVIGGLRAAEDVRIGTSWTIGVGIGGDGAIYDLQRPRRSGLFGSMLLPEDRLGQKSEHQLYNWVVNMVPPANYDTFHGVFMSRDNVRQLKSTNHLTE